MKKIIIFDLDGTLAESKTEMDREMSGLVSKLLERKEVAVISGGAYSQFENQFLKSLKCPEELLKKLYLFPTCSTSFYRYNKRWQRIYNEELSDDEKNKIFIAFSNALKEVSFRLLDNPYGEIIEDRGSQVTFSALGQKAPTDAKKTWDPDFKKRIELKKQLEKHLPEYNIRIGGSTSIDVTRRGIDKAYGIEKIEKHIGIKKDEMLFVGDALFEGGNDYPVKKAGVDCIETTGPEETKRIIRELIKP